MGDVVNLFGRKQKTLICNQCSTEGSSPKVVREVNNIPLCYRCSPKKKDSFEEIMKKNKENQERMRKDRANANKSVKRDYRLK